MRRSTIRTPRRGHVDVEPGHTEMPVRGHHAPPRRHVEGDVVMLRERGEERAEARVARPEQVTDRLG